MAMILNDKALINIVIYAEQYGPEKTNIELIR